MSEFLGAYLEVSVSKLRLQQNEFVTWFKEPAELGCGDLQLFSDVIDNEGLKPDIQSEDWKTEDSYTLLYELPKSIEESTLPGNRPSNLGQIMDTQTHKPLENWETSDILQWICEEYSRYNKDYEFLPLCKFRKVGINDFRDMQVQDFSNIIESQEDAEFLYSCKERLFASCADRKLKRIENWNSTDILEWICEVFTQDNRDYEKIPLRKFKDITIQALEQMTVAHFNALLDNWDDAEFLCNSKNALFRCSSCKPSYIPDHNQISNSAELNNNGFHSYYKETNTFFDKPARPFECENQNGPAEPVRIRKRGRPRTKEVQQVKSERRNVKLYQFLMNLLMDRKTNPSLIKWENYEEGKFKFVQNEKVAKLWGDRKLNGKMNYEKFSRAMRYYYRSEVLLPVSGKRLVYKFGPKAKGWRDAKPIL